MRNREQHQHKFLRAWSVLKARLEREASEEPWCTRQDAKAVIDDLTEEEFTVLTAVLGHLFSLNERFPQKAAVREHERGMAQFLLGKTITGIGWNGGINDVERTPSLEFSDGTYFECFNVVPVPEALCYDWGTKDELTEGDENSSLQ